MYDEICSVIEFSRNLIQWVLKNVIVSVSKLRMSHFPYLNKLALGFSLCIKTLVGLNIAGKDLVILRCFTFMFVSNWFVQVVGEGGLVGQHQGYPASNRPGATDPSNQTM